MHEKLEQKVQLKDGKEWGNVKDRKGKLIVCGDGRMRRNIEGNFIEDNKEINNSPTYTDVQRIW